MPRKTRKCQKKGRFFKLSHANMTSSSRHVYFVLFGPSCLEMKDCTAGRLRMPTAAAEVVVMPAITPRRVDADMFKRNGKDNMNKSGGDRKR